MVRINNIPFGEKKFNNGEVIYLAPELSEHLNKITLEFESNEDITSLMIGVHCIRHMKPDCKLELKMLYVPYSRMDREINKQVFSLKFFAQLINDLKFDKIYVLDVHSEVTKRLFNNLVSIDINIYVKEAIEEFKPDILFFPDAGAMAKYPFELYKRDNIQYISGVKERDLSDKGKIVAYKIDTCGIDITDKRILIIDDICCNGGTFMWAAKELKKLNVANIGLYVSHCENSAFDTNSIISDKNIEVIYTSPSIKHKVRVINV